MNYGFGMIWPLAYEYALRGWAVRRAGWDDGSLYGDSGRALRWVVYQNSLYWLIYREAGSGLKRSRVILNADFGVAEFYAEDWTVLTPECLLIQGGKRSVRIISKVRSDTPARWIRASSSTRATRTPPTEPARLSLFTRTCRAHPQPTPSHECRPWNDLAPGR